MPKELQKQVDYSEASRNTRSFVCTCVRAHMYIKVGEQGKAEWMGRGLGTWTFQTVCCGQQMGKAIVPSKHIQEAMTLSKTR
jgi:hypothetical protein